MKYLVKKSIQMYKVLWLVKETHTCRVLVKSATDHRAKHFQGLIFCVLGGWFDHLKLTSPGTDHFVHIVTLQGSYTGGAPLCQESIAIRTYLNGLQNANHQKEYGAVHHHLTF